MSEHNHWLPHIDRGLCNGCADCIAQCPTAALGWHGGRAALLNPERCTYCAHCEDICPVSAIELPFLIAREKTSEE